MKDGEWEGVTTADLRDAIDEMGPADGTDAKTEEILALVFEIAMKRRAEEANGRPFRFMGHWFVRKN